MGLEITVWISFFVTFCTFKCGIHVHIRYFRGPPTKIVLIGTNSIYLLRLVLIEIFLSLILIHCWTIVVHLIWITKKLLIRWIFRVNWWFSYLWIFHISHIPSIKMLIDKHFTFLYCILLVLLTSHHIIIYHLLCFAWFHCRLLNELSVKMRHWTLLCFWISWV